MRIFLRVSPALRNCTVLAVVAVPLLRVVVVVVVVLLLLLAALLVGITLCHRAMMVMSSSIS
jgi:hypothetical protein